uniref:Uncharacterized protein n=1 Tax=Setaria viridis TaxID=4556 RepID=A0A4U6SQU7_SETVI|nr:hypothetical protein SEVIR_9G050900v2 [Setaria viridis]
MFLQLANRAAESDETYSIIVNSAKKLAEDVEKSLKNRGDTDTATLQPDQAIKPKGVKVKEKAIHGSDRPIGGFEKATQKGKRIRMTQRHLDHLGTSTDQHHIQTPDYYPIGNALMHPSFGSFFGTLIMINIHIKEIPLNHLLQIPTIICFLVLIELSKATSF